MSIVHRRPAARAAAACLTHAAGALLLATGCSRLVAVVAPGAESDAIAGVWVDSAKATPTDTVAWKLDRNGSDWVLEIKVRRDSVARATTEQKVTRYGYWYLDGALGDTTRRALCFKPRPRDGSTCHPFQLDTVSGGGEGPVQRRIRIAGYRGREHTRTRVLVERLP